LVARLPVRRLPLRLAALRRLRLRRLWPLLVLGTLPLLLRIPVDKKRAFGLLSANGPVFKF
jgi:hypothetical protein